MLEYNSLYGVSFGLFNSALVLFINWNMCRCFLVFMIWHFVIRILSLQCTEEAHRPVDCVTVAKWILKNSAESENMNW